MFDNNYQIELQNIFFKDINITFKDMIKISFSLEGFLYSFLNYLALFFQIYFFSDFVNFSLNLYIFIICILTFKFLCLLTIYFKDKIIFKLNILFTNKKFYEMGDLFKIGLLILEIINLVYFILKLIIFPLMNYFFISYIKVEYQQNSYNKIEIFINLNFITLIFKIINEMFLNIYIMFKAYLIINSNNISKFIIKLFLCKFYITNYKEWYFINGICYSNIISEIFSLIFLISSQYIKNYYPQTWSKFTLNLFKNNILSTFKDLFDIKDFIIKIILEYYDFFFLILYNISYIEYNNYNIINFYFTMILFKHLFHGMKGNEINELMKIYKSLKIGEQDDEYEFSNYDYDTRIKENKNYEWIQFIKSKIIGTLILNIIFCLFFILFYLFNGYKIINIEESFLILIITFGIISIIEFTSKIIITLYITCFNNQKLFFYLTIGFIGSIILFYLNYLLIKSFLIMIIFIYSTFYIIFIRFYPEIQKIDLDFITINELSNDEHIEILNYN
jgi:hypothetical protein